ncbi:MAG: hypothetical protein IIC67_00540 [Thaumarchaeota archaeon]|nr:hypothetical protein [Nitrososphaerota archaeon]
MSNVLLVDESETSTQVKDNLKDIEGLVTYLIEDPKSVEFALPILFTVFGTFPASRIEIIKNY